MIWSDLIWFHLIWSDLIWSDLISFNLISSHLSHLISSHLIWSALIWSDLISSHLIWSHLISSQVIQNEFDLPFPGRAAERRTWPETCCVGFVCQKNTLWAIVNPNRVVNQMTSWSSAFCAFAPLHLMNLRWCRQVLEPVTFFVHWCARMWWCISMRRRWVWQLWGEDSTVSWWHPGWRVRIHHGTKTAQRSRRRENKRGRISPLYPNALVMPPCVYRTRKCSLSGGDTA